MRPSDVARASGVSLNTVYRHLLDGKLAGTWSGTRWSIREVDAYAWAQQLWAEGRAWMYPPDHVIGYCSWFNVH